MSSEVERNKLEPEPTAAQRIALAAVRNGVVKLDGEGCRSYPSQGVSGTALTACFKREWCAWDTDKRIAYVTPRGYEALR